MFDVRCLVAGRCFGCVVCCLMSGVCCLFFCLIAYVFVAVRCVLCVFKCACFFGCFLLCVGC